MKITRWIVLVAVSAGALCGVAAPAVASPALASISPTRSVRTVLPADVNDFVFDSFSADYYLGQDKNGRSTLKTVETLVAEFPAFDQNHGIRRALVDTFQGHPTDISVVSVTDEHGTPRDWHDASDNESSGATGFRELIVRDNDSGVYVHGKQTYVITYTQHNVTNYFANTDDDEFYWDTNGTGWPQPFGMVRATVHVPGALAGALTGTTVCYRGYEGSTARCDIASTAGTGQTTYSVTANQIGPYENMTISIGFRPHTFTPRDDSFLATPLSWFQLLALGAAVIGGIWAIMLRTTTLANGTGPGRGTIVAEYAPPRGVGIFTEAVVIQKTTKAAAASLLSLAVNGHLRIIETEGTSWLPRKPVYTLELLNNYGLDDEAAQIVDALFGDSRLAGAQYTMSTTDVLLSGRVRAMVAAAKKKAVSGGWIKRIPIGTSLFPGLLAVVGAVGSAIVAIAMVAHAFGGILPLAIAGVAIVAAIFVFGTISRKPLTDSGAALRDHLQGLELYIRMAEADRLRVLQSPEGAERTPVSVDSSAEVLKLNEKLLPYAVLFSLEKRWAEELSKFYTESNPPDWYVGSAAFNGALFAASIGSMSSTASSSYSGSSASSSSGGSGGGGFSGGGGGGGGGGGV